MSEILNDLLLTRRMAFNFERYIRGYLRNNGIHLDPHAALALLVLEGKEMTSADIGRQVPGSNPTYFLKRLEDLGYTERWGLSQDGRVKMNKLTPRGKVVLELLKGAVTTLSIVCPEGGDFYALDEALKKREC